MDANERERGAKDGFKGMFYVRTLALLYKMEALDNLFDIIGHLLLPPNK